MTNAELAQAFLTSCCLIIYLSSANRSVVSLHDLVNNKIKDIDELEDKEEEAKNEEGAGQEDKEIEGCGGESIMYLLLPATKYYC